MTECLDIAPLAPEDSEILWNLVDYGAVASMAPVRQIASSDHNFSIGTDTPASESFTELISPDSAQLGLMAYTQPPDLWWASEEDLRYRESTQPHDYERSNLYQSILR